MIKQVLLLLNLLLSICAFGQTVDTTQHIIKGRNNSHTQQNKPYVIVISVDAMRYDYAQRYGAKNLLALSKTGIQATTMQPSYPSITFPNHYTLMTGLYPSHTGLVCNRFYDRKSGALYSSKLASAGEAQWYGGTPLWVLAEKQKMVSAAFYWVGSDVPIQGTYPTYRYKYNEQIGIRDRINTVVNWLKLPANRRPHLITLYFPEVDHAGHHFGPDAPETKRAVLFIDSAVNALQKAVKATGLKVNFVFMSDHGMTKVDNLHPLQIPAVIDTAKFKVTGEDVLVELYAKDTAAIKNTYEALKKNTQGKYTVYLRSNTPARWHYNKTNDRFNRIGDILLVPYKPYIFVYANKAKPNPGVHGYDPVLVPDMQATFYAWGPAFKKGLKISSFQNVEVYPMLAQLLGLKITEPIDGGNALAKKVLRTK
ncbi:ectonucleotide pyrophosphatase/phosphodiesterase [Mucilaginibacter sp. PAMB04168]|uniref:alkaline phosphatase family protein n=1 Tax=Mucilaginibacter sp. PAMB04168 TaxID=3138567 RepID=UPI0031F66334